MAFNTTSRRVTLLCRQYSSINFHRAYFGHSRPTPVIFSRLNHRNRSRQAPFVKKSPRADFSGFTLPSPSSCALREACCIWRSCKVFITIYTPRKCHPTNSPFIIRNVNSISQSSLFRPWGGFLNNIHTNGVLRTGIPNVRYFSKAPNNNVTSNPSTKSNGRNSEFKATIEPRLQDTEVPLWSFFSDSSTHSTEGKNKSSWEGLPHLTKIDLDQFENVNNHKNADGTTLAPPPILKVLTILLPERNSLLIALGALTVATAATMQFPNAIGQMIDILSGIPVDTGMNVFTNIDVNTVGGADSVGDISPSLTETQKLEQMKLIALQMMGYFTIGAVATFSHSAMFDSIGQRIGATLRKKLFRTILHQEVAFFDQNRAGELANRLSTDVHEVAEHLVQNLSVFLTNAVRSLTAIMSMIAISPTLTLYLSPIVPLLGGCAHFYGSFIKRWSKQHLDVLAHSTHVATERFSGISTVLSFGQRSKEVARYSSVIEAAYGYARRVALFQGAFLGSSYFVGNAALLGVLWVGSTQVFDGHMTAGSLAGFCMFAGHLAEGVSEISESVGGFLKAQGSGARLFSLLDRDSPDFDDKCSKSVDVSDHPFAKTLPSSYKPTVRFDSVKFSYPSHPNVPILNEVFFSMYSCIFLLYYCIFRLYHTLTFLLSRQVSFTLANGEMLAVTGSSGK